MPQNLMGQIFERKNEGNSVGMEAIHTSQLLALFTALIA